MPLANKVALVTGGGCGVGASTAKLLASQIKLAGRLPLPPAVLHQAINQAFVDALHSSYLIAALTILVACVLVAGLSGQKQTKTRMRGVPAVASELTGASAQPYAILEDTVSGLDVKTG